MEIISTTNLKKNNSRFLMKQEQIKTTLSKIFYEKKIKWRYFNDLNSKIVNITKVILSKDASTAKVYFNLYEFLDNKIDIEDILKKLNMENVVIAKYLSNEIRLRKIPSLIFKIDKEFSKVQNVEKLLDDLRADTEK